MADIGPIHQAAGNHPPADRSLQAAKRQKSNEAEMITAGDRLLDPEPCKRKRKGQADQPTKDAMDIFPEEDGFEFIHRHTAIDELILGRGAIGLKFGFPLGRIHRR